MRTERSVPAASLPPARRPRAAALLALLSPLAPLALGALGACTAEHAASDGDPAHRPGAEASAGGPDAARIAGDDCVGDATITGQGMGLVRLGATAEDVRARCGGVDTAFTIAEGLPERGVVVRVAGARVVALTTVGDTVGRVIVPDAGPTTERGIGVGSTVDAVRAAYGELCALQGEGRRLVAAAALPGVSFVLARGDSTRIVEVLAHGVDACGLRVG
jgi:hypothetical protein